MSHETSPSTQQPYGIARVTRVWQVPRSTVYARRDRRDHPSLQALVKLARAFRVGLADLFPA